MAMWTQSHCSSKNRTSPPVGVWPRRSDSMRSTPILPQSYHGSIASIAARATVPIAVRLIARPMSAGSFQLGAACCLLGIQAGQLVIHDRGKLGLVHAQPLEVASAIPKLECLELAELRKAGCRDA